MPASRSQHTTQGKQAAANATAFNAIAVDDGIAPVLGLVHGAAHGAAYGAVRGPGLVDGQS